MHFIVASTRYAGHVLREHRHIIGSRDYKFLFHRNSLMRIDGYRFSEADTVWVTDDPACRDADAIMEEIYRRCELYGWPKFCWVIDGRLTEPPQDQMLPDPNVNPWQINVETVDQLILVDSALREYIQARWPHVDDFEEPRVDGGREMARTSFGPGEGYTLSVYDAEDAEPGDWEVELHDPDDEWGDENLILDAEDMERIRSISRILSEQTHRHQVCCTRAIFETLLRGYVPRPRRQIVSRLARMVPMTEEMANATVTLNEALQDNSHAFSRLIQQITEDIESDFSTPIYNTVRVYSGQIQSDLETQTRYYIEVTADGVIVEHRERQQTQWPAEQVFQDYRWACSCGQHSRAWRSTAREAADGWVRHVRRRGAGAL